MKCLMWLAGIMPTLPACSGTLSSTLAVCPLSSAVLTYDFMAVLIVHWGFHQRPVIAVRLKALYTYSIISAGVASWHHCRACRQICSRLRVRQHGQCCSCNASDVYQYNTNATICNILYQHQKGYERGIERLCTYVGGSCLAAGHFQHWL